MPTATRIDQLAVDTLRFLSVDMVEAAKSGHPGLPLGAAPMAYVLWRRHLRFNPANPKWFGRDRFVLSAGHGSALNYALLHVFGYDLPIEELKNFRQLHSRTPGHPEFGYTVGIEATTGPLGQGLGMAVGMAIADAWLANRFPATQRFTYALVSDGDLMEGVAFEAASIAGHLKLGRLVCLYDDNDISLDGPTHKSFTEDVTGRFEALGWQVIFVADGNDLEAIDQAIAKGKETDDRPTLIRVKTQIGYGSPKANSSAAHGAPLGHDAACATREKLGWCQEPLFYVPNEVREVAAQAKTDGIQWEGLWNAAVDRLDNAEELKRIATGELPADWAADLDTLQFEDKPIATRDSGKTVLNALAKRIPEIVGGSADLASSTKTIVDNSTDFQSDKLDGRNLWFGVREHGMGAVVNGMALAGLRPFGSTFLVFSDYMRGSIRLSALMNIPSTWVFSHDSVFVGEDGPTHEPIEHVEALRLIPNLRVYRPADAKETAACWRMIIGREEPACLILTRQNVPLLPQSFDEVKAGVEKGAWVVRDCANPKAILIATGSEVSLALEAADLLDHEGIGVRVVSMPCVEIARSQSEEIRRGAVPKGIPRVAIEAGVTSGWQFWADEVVGIDRFGESAPGGTVYKFLGMTVETIRDKVRKAIGEVN
jgi:transketolase